MDLILSLFGIILLIQVVILFLLLAPLPPKIGQAFLNVFTATWENAHVKLFMTSLLVSNVIAIIYSQWEANKQSERLTTHPLFRLEAQERMFSAQFLGYLCGGSTLFLLVLWGLQSVLSRYFQLQTRAAASSQALSRQQANNAGHLETIEREITQATALIEGLRSSVAEVDALLQEHDQLNKQYDDLLEENKGLVELQAAQPSSST